MENKQHHPRRVLYWGPMFSGKTTSLVKIYDIIEASGQSVLFLYPSTNTRDQYGEIRTHDGKIKKAKVFNNSEMLIALIEKHNPQNVCIDEVQFVEDIVKVCDILYKKNINVFMAGLNMTWKSTVWPSIGKIIHTCEVEQLFAICKNCGNFKAMYNVLLEENLKLKINERKNDVIIGDCNQYKVLCMRCFFVEKECI